ncbi:MAG: penicillin-binding protein activator [Pseudomonadota bacterium]
MAEAGALGQIARAGKWFAIVGAMALSACQVVPKGPPRPTGPVAPPTRPETGTLPTDTQRNRVALLVPMSGPNAGVGESIANAANMAVLDTGGKTIRVTMYDTAGGAAAAAQKAIAEGNRLILGPLLADDVRAVAPVARSARIPVVSFSNDASVAGNGVYVMGFAPAQSIDRVVQFARSKGVTKFAGLIPSGLYGQRASTAFLRSVESAGGQVVSLQTFDRNAGSMSAAVTRLSASSAYEAVLVADSARAAVQFAPMVRAKGGAAARMLGTELWNAEGALGANPALRGAWFASVSDGVYNQLATKYRTRFGKGAYRLASLGYDSVLLVTRIGSDWAFGAPFPVARLADAGGFTGIDGAFRFGRDGVAERALEVQQAGPGGFTVVDAAPRGF